MDAIVIAGHTPGKTDALLTYAGVENKALIPIAGKPMIKWVTDALVGSGYVERLILVGFDNTGGIDFGPKPVVCVPDQGRLLKNVWAGARRALQDTTRRDRMLICACDIPLITTAIVDDHVATMLETQHDLYYTLIDRATMLTRFPTSRRSYTHLRDGAFCGGDLNMAGARAIETNQQLWDDLLEARKSALRQAQRVGFWTLFQLATRTLSIEAGERRAEKILGIQCRVVRSPHAEIGMDVDKPFQLDIVRAELGDER
ncbi:MAG TPA: nucleotidyltransferase family protein [Anaerolineae bacterium]|nr:nucleotidyltransferase family protein [Anaerolineae bacterium]